MNDIQKVAYSLIQSDARFLYTIVDIHQHANNISSNYIIMSQPYIGLFADGAEQWGRKVGLNPPMFNNQEKEYYTKIRQCHKFFNLDYKQYYDFLFDKFKESDKYYYSIRSLREKLIGYYNVGTDLCNGEYCGNTILCSMYLPFDALNDKNSGQYLKNMSVVAGKIAAYYKCTDYPAYKYNDNLYVKYKDFHFYNNSPLKENNDLGFLLFSVLCTINYVIIFINNYLTEEIPQKFKYAYLQYYYLCDFVDEINKNNDTDFHIDKSLYNRDLRNCIAHYGLGQYLKKEDIIENDILFGLTRKALNLDYIDAKEKLYFVLGQLVEQIKSYIFES